MKEDAGSLVAVAAPLAIKGGDAHCKSWMERIIGDGDAAVEVVWREDPRRWR